MRRCITATTEGFLFFTSIELNQGGTFIYRVSLKKRQCFCVWLMNDDLVNGNVTKPRSRIRHTTSQRPGLPSPGLPTFQSQRDKFNWLQEEHWKHKSEKKSICISSLGKKIFPFLWKYFFVVIFSIKVNIIWIWTNIWIKNDIWIGFLRICEITTGLSCVTFRDRTIC